MADVMFNSNEFRQVLGNLPTGVVVVSFVQADNNKPHGITIGSFSSISLAPPLVGFFLGNESQAWSCLGVGAGFGVNVLGQQQSELSDRFASTEDNVFESVEFSLSKNFSVPQLSNTVAFIECSVERVETFGDHGLVVGAVQEIQDGQQLRRRQVGEDQYEQDDEDRHVRDGENRHRQAPEQDHAEVSNGLPLVFHKGTYGTFEQHR